MSPVGAVRTPNPMKSVQLQLRAAESYHPKNGELVNEQVPLVNWQSR